MASRKKLEYAIVGGGITGLTLAIALHHRGVKVEIYEQALQFGEIGAGVSFSPNAIQAMKICHSGVHDAFEKVCTHNMSPSKKSVWFDYYDGYHQAQDPKNASPTFSISNGIGQNAVHRARFLDELVPLIPQGLAHFGKRLDNVREQEDEKLLLTFADGSTATADAVLGCDGIKSRVRQIVVGMEHPSAQPKYTYKYAYRALVAMDVATAALGEGKAQNACMHLGPDGHVLTFPVDHGRTMNVVAFRTAQHDWQDYPKLTAPSKREDALTDFKGFGTTVNALLHMAKPDLDTWAIFDLGEHPLTSYVKSRICLVGDAAHASSPHHGAGAGMCIEDTAILAELLADDVIVTAQDIRRAFQVYDNVRRERTQWLVQSSRFIGDCYEWRADGIGDDMRKIEAEIERRNDVISKVDVSLMCREAKATLHEQFTRA